MVVSDAASLQLVGSWVAGDDAARFDAEGLIEAAACPRLPAFVLREPATGRLGVGFGGGLAADGGLDCLGVLPALYPEWLGDRGFTRAHGLRFPYVTGAMARGIATTRIVIEMARAGMMGFFGSAGLGLAQVEAALDELGRELGELPWGCNLIHSPNEPDLEEGMVDLLLARGVRRVESSAFMGLTPAVVRYAFSGVRSAPDGSVLRDNHLFAKISRPETAGRFMAPPPAELLETLVRRGRLTADEARLARRLPVAEQITIEADSGGHTDRQVLTAVMPVVVQLRDRLAAEHGHGRQVRIGASGGLGAPAALAAAFAMGAAYVLTGSVNQAAIESGVSDEARQMLAQAEVADVAMAPSADMFEIGAKVQVLKRGTMFSARAGQLWELYNRYGGLDEIPADVRAKLEQQLFRQPLDAVWESTRSFWAQRNPQELAAAERDKRHKMALVFRWYLGFSSRWPVTGQPDRRVDFQLWCGPAMGSFNDWVRGSFLEQPGARGVVQIALNLLEGAARLTRAQQLRSHGVPVPAAAFVYTPRELY